MNTVSLIGNVGKEVKVTTLEDGKLVATFNVATNENWIDKQTGEAKTKTTWHRAIAWNKTAEKVRDYINKGNLVSIKGKLVNREYDKTIHHQISAKKTIDVVVKQYATEIKIFEIMKY
jgi:single-strand DNA-binding protein